MLALIVTTTGCEKITGETYDTISALTVKVDSKVPFCTATGPIHLTVNGSVSTVDTDGYKSHTFTFSNSPTATADKYVDCSRMNVEVRYLDTVNNGSGTIQLNYTDTLPSTFNKQTCQVSINAPAIVTQSYAVFVYTDFNGWDPGNVGNPIVNLPNGSGVFEFRCF